MLLVGCSAGANANVGTKRRGLSQGTVVNYMTSIQQHLRVTSHAELMKLILTHRPPAPPIPRPRVRGFPYPKTPENARRLVDGVRVPAVA